MKEFEQKAYKAFQLFGRQMPLVTAGSLEYFNSCTIGWGSLGNLWSRAGTNSPTVTVYVYPSRYTFDFMTASDTFTVNFLPEEYRDAIGYMGSHSGREGDKATAAGLTPIPFGDGVTYQEAELTFLCKKLCQQPFDKDAIHPEIQAYYQSKPGVYPPDENGNWQTHYLFIGEVIDVLEKP